ncbi:MAG: hypothetical protein ACU83O_01875, partial [Gammaproteobacteria bacterium]
NNSAEIYQEWTSSGNDAQQKQNGNGNEADITQSFNSSDNNAKLTLKNNSAVSVRVAGLANMA